MGDYGQVFAFDNEAERVNWMRSMGAKNVNPPLEHTKFVRIKANGRILPWNPLLADQTELVENCDKDGNTDRAAWEQDIIADELDAISEDEQQLMAMEKSRRTAQIQAEQLQSEYRAEDAVSVEPRPTELPPDIVPYDRVQELVSMLEK
jgi:hypothetical protein